MTDIKNIKFQNTGISPITLKITPMFRRIICFNEENRRTLVTMIKINNNLLMACIMQIPVFLHQF